MIDDLPTIEKKIDRIKDMFFERSREEKIEILLNLGRSLQPFADEFKTSAYQITGCQSILYLSSNFDNGRVYFNAYADALISSGLAALLISVYSGETPETILKKAPTFLIDLELLSSLTPSRSNGLAHIHRQMRKDALKFLLSTAKSLDLNPAPL